MASTEFSNSPQVTQFTAAELGANSWRPGNAGRGRKKCSGRPQVSCLARVGQAASVQAWEKRGIGLERRQPPGRPSWEPLRFCRPPARPPARFSLSRKPARAETATHPQVGADQECGSWPKGLGCPLSPESRTPSIRVHHVEKGVEEVHPRAKPGGKAWYGVGVAPRLLGRTRPQGRAAGPIQPCPGSRPLGLASQSPPLGSPGPTGRMGTEASFLPMLCL